MTIILISAICGLIIGSFLNVVIYRLPIMLEREQTLEHPQELNLALPRSYCPNCKHPIAAQDNIPLLSYILLAGKCRHCQQKIPLLYPTIELLSTILTIIVVLHFGLTWKTPAALLLTWSLIALVGIDYKHLILPDEITIPVLWIGLLLSITDLFTHPVAAILGASCGYLSLWLIAYIYKIIKKTEGMGYGDFKLLAMLGAWLGWQQLPFIIFCASLIGSLIGLFMLVFKKYNLKHQFPFGPYLALAGFIALLWGNNIINYYLHYFVGIS